ncbi:hypothetical protein [Micromonospora fluostatini]|uniref:hypothetical protein n=1 Tax=Micromonospora sp. JCM 30529 TaxID=3421643 RepID=UPI003D183F0D
MPSHRKGRPTGTGGSHQRHRLADRASLAEAYTSRHGLEVAAYALAARDLVEGCGAIRPVDTWSQVANEICAGRPKRDRERFRKRLSRHFTPETKGPPWQTVELVAGVTVPDRSQREAKLKHLALLHRKARGDWPSDWRPRHADGSRPPQNQPPQNRPPQTTGPARSGAGPGQGSEGDELSWWKRRCAGLEQQLTESRAALATSQGQVTALRVEVERLRGRQVNAGSEEPPRHRGAAGRRDARNEGHFPAGQPAGGPHTGRDPARLDTATPQPPIAVEADYWTRTVPPPDRAPAPVPRRSADARRFGPGTPRPGLPLPRP